MGEQLGEMTNERMGEELANEAKLWATYNDQWNPSANKYNNTIHEEYLNNSRKAQKNRISQQQWQQCSEPILDGGQGKKPSGTRAARPRLRGARKVKGVVLSEEYLIWGTGKRATEAIRVQQRG